MLNFPCICSHTKRYHKSDNSKNMYCYACWDILSEQDHPKLINVDNMYHEFVSDNLRFLEQKYEEKLCQ